VDPAGIEVRAELLAGLPVVSAVPERLGLGELVASYLPEPDPRYELAPGLAVGVLVRNLALAASRSTAWAPGPRATTPPCRACARGKPSCSMTTGPAGPWTSCTSPTGRA